MGRQEASNGKRPVVVETDSDAEDVRLCFQSQDGCEDFFNVSGDMNIKQLLQKYCRKRQINYETAIFLCDSKRLARRGTVAQAGLVDRAVIDVMLPQTGGGPTKYFAPGVACDCKGSMLEIHISNKLI